MFAWPTEYERELTRELSCLKARADEENADIKSIKARKEEIDNGLLPKLVNKRWEDGDFPPPMLRLVRLSLEATLSNWYKESDPFLHMNHRDDRLQGLFFYAVQRTNHDEALEICKNIHKRGGVLKESGTVDRQDKFGKTPLFFSVKANNVPCTKWLIEQGLNVHHADKDGQTPVCEAARYGSHDACEVLLKAGARVARKDTNMRTPLQIAKRWGHPHVTGLLVEYRIKQQLEDALSPKVVPKKVPAAPIPLPSSLLGKICAVADERPNILLPLNVQTARCCREDAFWQGYVSERFKFVTDGRWKKRWGTWKKIAQAIFHRIRIGPQLLRSSQGDGSIPYGTENGVTIGEQEAEIPIDDAPADAHIPPFVPQCKRFDISSDKDLDYTHGMSFSYIVQILEAAFIPADQEMWLAFLNPYRLGAPNNGEVDASRFYRYQGSFMPDWQDRLNHKCEFKGWACLHSDAVKRLNDICVEYDLGLRMCETRYDMQALIEGLLWRSLAVCQRRLITEPLIDELVESNSFAFKNITKDKIEHTLPPREETIEKGWYRLTISDYGSGDIMQTLPSCYTVILPCGKGARVQTSSLKPGKHHSGYGPQPTLTAARIFLPYYADAKHRCDPSTPASGCVSYFHDFNWLKVKYPSWHEVPQVTPSWLVEMHKPKLPTVKVNPHQINLVDAVSEESSLDSTPADLMVKIFDPAESQREINKLDFSQMSDCSEGEESFGEPNSEDEMVAQMLGLPPRVAAPKIVARNVQELVAQEARQRPYLPQPTEEDLELMESEEELLAGGYPSR